MTKETFINRLDALCRSCRIPMEHWEDEFFRQNRKLKLEDKIEDAIKAGFDPDIFLFAYVDINRTLQGKAYWEPLYKKATSRFTKGVKKEGVEEALALVRGHLRILYR